MKCHKLMSLILHSCCHLCFNILCSRARRYEFHSPANYGRTTANEKQIFVASTRHHFGIHTIICHRTGTNFFGMTNVITVKLMLMGVNAIICRFFLSLPSLLVLDIKRLMSLLWDFFFFFSFRQNFMAKSWFLWSHALIKCVTNHNSITSYCLRVSDLIHNGQFGLATVVSCSTIIEPFSCFRWTNHFSKSNLTLRKKKENGDSQNL